jgi:hypothetical protein
MVTEARGKAALWLRRLFSPPWVVRRSFTPAVLTEIGNAITQVELRHAGEVCFAVEHALEWTALRNGVDARARALEVFGQMRVWDTENNNGVLVYVLFAERALEIVADRGIASKVPQESWDALCHEVEREFHEGRFREGSLRAVRGIAALLERHFPLGSGDRNELPDQPRLL